LETWVRSIHRKKQAIFYGPPGTGKTYIAQKLTKHLIADNDGFDSLVQFHPAYAYEDFMIGIRPITKEGQLFYDPVPGHFIEFCKEAEKRTGKCVLIIDEINRANLAQVFGELMYLLEYRDQDIQLAGGKIFKIPDNVILIGTMNTADRSIALVDHALRRRFAFLELAPNYEVLKSYHAGKDISIKLEQLIGLLKRLNSQIDDKNFYIGQSYFLISDLEKHIEDIWRMEIVPYLEEFFFDQPTKVDEFRWEKIKTVLL
jgi:5-methylcytosine-specific restriction enzyme B